MPNQDEVRAAAERLRDLSGEVRDCLDGFMPHDSLTYRGSLLHEVTQYALVLQKHYLAEHLEDDNEPVTEEWLKSVGFKDLEGQGCYPIGILIVDFWLCVDSPSLARWSLQTDDEQFIAIKTLETRNDVRRLCRALGIEFTENARD